LSLQAENFLKLPQYDKAIAALEEAQRDEPSADKAERLAKLYAEVGDENKAAEAAVHAEEAARAEREKERAHIAQDLIRVVAVVESLKDDSPKAAGGPAYGYLGHALADGLAADLAKSPYMQVLPRDRRTQAELDKQREAWAVAHPDATPAEVEEALGGAPSSAAFVVDGQFTVIP